MSRLKLSDFGIMLWWTMHHEESGYYDHIEDVLEMDERQVELHNGLPVSLFEMAREAISSTQDSIGSLQQYYKNSHDSGESFCARRRLLHDIEIAKARRELIIRFLEA